MGLATAIVVGSLISAGTSIYAHRSQQRAGQRARAEDQKAYDDQIRREEQRMAEERRMWEEEQAMLREFHEAEQRQLAEQREWLRYQWDVDQANAEPYREAGHAALSQLTQRAGLPAPPPRQKPTPPAFTQTPAAPAAPSGIVEKPPTAPPPPAPDRNRTMGTLAELTAPTRPPMMARTELPVSAAPDAPMVQSEGTMTAEAYARLAQSPEALAQMTPEEQQTFAMDLSQIPMSALLTRRSGRRMQANG